MMDCGYTMVEFVANNVMLWLIFVWLIFVWYINANIRSILK